MLNRNFFYGMAIGAAMMWAAAGLMQAAHAQEVEAQAGEGERTASVVGGDWGAQTVEARSGQRIPAPLSLAEVNRISFEGDRVAGVRAAQNGLPGAPSIEFDRDAATGDLYVVVAQGRAGQVLSAFVSTERRHTYHLLFTIRDQPANQLFIRNLNTDEHGAAVQGSADQASDYQEAVVGFATFAIDAEPEPVEARPERIGQDLELVSLGRVSRGSLSGEIFEFRNRGFAAAPLRHDAFAGPGVIAVASPFDEIPPNSAVRVVVIERAE